MNLAASDCYLNSSDSAKLVKDPNQHVGEHNVTVSETTSIAGKFEGGIGGSAEGVSTKGSMGTLATSGKQGN